MDINTNSSVRTPRYPDVVMGIPVTSAPWGSAPAYGVSQASPPSAPPMPTPALPSGQRYQFGGARQPHEFEAMFDATLRDLEYPPRETARRYCLVEQGLRDHACLGLPTTPAYSSFTHLDPYDDAHAFKQAWALAYRATTAAMAHYYHLDPAAYGIPSEREAHLFEPADTCSRLLQSTQRMAPVVLGYEMPKAADLPADQRPSFGGFFNTEDGQSGGVLCSAFIKVFYGPTDASGVHHYVPLMLAEHHGGASWSHPGPFPIFQLPHTANERGNQPFVLDAEEWFVPQPTAYAPPY